MYLQYVHVSTCMNMYMYVRATMKEMVLYCYLLLSIIMVTCTCKYLYVHVHVCKGYNERDSASLLSIVIYYNGNMYM